MEKTIKVEKLKPVQKNKLKKERNDYFYGIVFIIFSILLEIINFVTLGLGVLPSSFGIEFSIILIIAGIIFTLPTEWLKITVTTIVLVFQGVMNVINACVYKNLFNITTIDMLFARGGETGAVFEIDFINWGSLCASLALLAVYITTIVLASRHLPKMKSRFKCSSICYMIAIALVVECSGLISYSLLDKAVTSDLDTSSYVFENGAYLYGSTDLKFANMKKYGFYAYYLKSLENYVDYNIELSEEEETAMREFLDESAGFSYSGSTYEGQEVSGSMKGDNLIMIMMESFEWFAIDQFNTPNLYNLIYNNSMYFTNYYSRNATNFSEDISILGNSPNEYAFSRIVNKVGVNTPESLPNKFKNDGYESVNFFHDYLGSFYDRYTLNTSIGFDNVYALEDSEIEGKSEDFGDFIDDGTFVEYWKEEFMPTDENFFSFFTTVSTHGPYSESNERFSEYYDRFDVNYENFCNYALESDLGYILPEVGTSEYEVLKEYKSKAMALDNAIGVILDYLNTQTDENGEKLIDNTTIILFADHNAYYQDLSYTFKNVEKYANENTAYRVPFAISSSALPVGENDVFCNTYDIYPTICDLFGFSYNKNLTHGYSIFSDEIGNSMFLSSLSGIFDENVYSLSMDVFYINGEEVSEEKAKSNEQILKFKDKVNLYVQKQIMIEKYYRVNYAENYQ